jgi:hypothetical protein
MDGDKMETLQEALERAMARPLHYRLNEQGEPEVVEDVIVWARWFEEADRTVRKTVVAAPSLPRGLMECEVSTVFLALDHSFGFDGPPLLFETMLFEIQESTVEMWGRPHTFRRDLGHLQWRYHTREEALGHHEKLVAALERGVEIPDLPDIE